MVPNACVFCSSVFYVVYREPTLLQPAKVFLENGLSRNWLRKCVGGALPGDTEFLSWLCDLLESCLFNWLANGFILLGLGGNILSDCLSFNYARDYLFIVCLLIFLIFGSSVWFIPITTRVGLFLVRLLWALCSDDFLFSYSFFYVRGGEFVPFTPVAGIGLPIERRFLACLQFY